MHWIATKKQTLWVHWVEVNYLKVQNWMKYKLNGNTSWVWRRICVVKVILRPGFTDEDWGRDPNAFSSTRCFDWLRGEGQTLAWTKAIWNHWVLPKHQIIGWLVARKALQTADRMLRHGLDVDSTCPLCEEEETVHHLFFDCLYSRQICSELHKATGLHFPANQCLQWCMDSTGNRLQSQLYTAMVLGNVYNIWIQRKCRNEKKLSCPRVIVDVILGEVRSRVRGHDRNSLSQSELNWLRDKNIM
ncbi:hypothetical protein vseg_007867 [Gypsophila vaccaria]